MRRQTRPPTTAARAFTIIESLIVVIVIVIMVAILLPATGRGRHGGVRQLQDSTQIRGTVQAMIVWSQSNKGRYPLPSEIDAQNFTVAGEVEAKNTTGNILSVLIYNGNISPEICVSPAESNTSQVMRMEDYQFTNPLAAIKPDQALWDPRFRGTPLDAQHASFPTLPVANQSYAHLVPFGERRKRWQDTFSTTEAVFGNRGPQYAPGDSAPQPADGRWSLVKGLLGEGSNTLLIHGGRTSWEGNIAYNDGSVMFETKPAPEGVTYQRMVNSKPRATPDNLFVNETDEVVEATTSDSGPRGSNAYLRPIATVEPNTPIYWID